MECPYCLTLVDDGASVCKTCTRDVYLFRSLLEKIEKLEQTIQTHQDPVDLQLQIEHLQKQLDEERVLREKRESKPVYVLRDIGQFLFIPLFLLLLAHALITVIYDMDMIFLRIASVLFPLPFGFYLFKTKRRFLLGWFAATAGLALSSVIGMSAITGWVDQTPVLPQSMIEWREFLEYSASITFSFLTGMLLGGMAYHRAHRPKAKPIGPLLTVLLSKLNKGKSSPEDLQKTIKKLEEMGGNLIAAGSTAMSVYTGLKAFM